MSLHDRIKDLVDKVGDLEDENEKIKTKLIDLTFKENYSKETELMEFVRELYESLNDVDKSLTKDSIVNNLKTYIEKFARDNKLML